MGFMAAQPALLQGVWANLDKLWQMFQTLLARIAADTGIKVGWLMLIAVAVGIFLYLWRRPKRGP
jgi:hypothetical protein